MSELDLALEALNLLREWSTWLVGLATAAIGYTASMLGSRAPVAKVDLSSKLAMGAIGAFVVSISLASAILAALPTVVQRLPAAAAAGRMPSVYRIGLFGFYPVPLGVFAYLEQLWFWVGIACLAGAAYARLAASAKNG